MPKIPSMNIMDLVAAIAPECKVKFNGIRPGEKIHELLVSSDEARQTLEFSDMFVIQPAHKWWNHGTWAEGEPLSDGFTYGSDNNPNQLSVEGLQQMVADL